MNIGILIDNITNKAGTERAVSNLANILTNLKHKVFLISISSKEGECDFSLNKNIEIIHLGLSEAKTKKDSIKILFTLTNTIKKIVNMYALNSLVGTGVISNVCISRFSKLFTVGCEHFSFESGSLFHHLLAKMYYGKLSKVVLLTEKDRSCYSFLKNTCVIPNSIPKVGNVYPDYDSKNILAVGRLSYQKGFNLLIEIAEKTKNIIPDWKINIVGDGEDKEYLLQLIKEKKLQEYVNILPYHKDIESLYLSSSIYAMTSRFEGLPMVLLESQNYGLPAIAFDCPCGPSDVIVGTENGYLIDFGNKDLFAEKLIRLCKNVDLRKQMGLKSKELALRFSEDSVQRLWSELFKV